MIRSFILFVLPMLSVLVSPGMAMELRQSGDCDFDRPAMLAMEINDFDQVQGNGWRKLAANGCYPQAADLIREYGLAHGVAKRLIFHEAQMRAFAGQTQKAVELFREDYLPQGKADPLGSNLYLDVTIAHLKKDRQALLSAAEEYLALPRPESLKLVDSEGKPVKMAWPVNKRVVESLVSCFEETYLVAYKACTSR